VSTERVSDAELVARAAQGDPAAFGELVDRYRAAVYRAALAALGSHAEAEDVAQEAFLTAYQQLAQFRGEASFKTWLLTITWHQAINRRRSLLRWWRLVLPNDNGDGDDVEHQPIRGESSPEQTLAASQLRRAIRDEVRSLPPKLRDALLLALAGEYTYEELGAMLNIPVGTIKWRVSEARRVASAIEGMPMWDDQLDRAIDDVARELTIRPGPADLRARVLGQIESPAVPPRSWLWLIAALALAVVVIAVAIFRGGAQRPGTTQGQRSMSQAPPAVPRSLVWVDRQGREEPVSAPPRAYGSVRLSPDGRRVAFDIRDQASDIWLWDLGRQVLTRMTFDPALDISPIWTPDGRRIVFASMRAGVANLFWQPADGSGAAERLTTSPNSQLPQSFSPDGRNLVFEEETSTTQADLLLLILDSPPRIEPLIQTRFNAVVAGDVSPDGRWLAYQSDESGRYEIYARPFPAGIGKWQVSTAGGTAARWRRDGQELFYVNRGKLMAVTTEPSEPSFTVSRATELFEGPYADSFDVTADGQRFLMIRERP